MVTPHMNLTCIRIHQYFTFVVYGTSCVTSAKRMCRGWRFLYHCINLLMRKTNIFLSKNFSDILKVVMIITNKAISWIVERFNSVNELCLYEHKSLLKIFWFVVVIWRTHLPNHLYWNWSDMIRHTIKY